MDAPRPKGGSGCGGEEGVKYKLSALFILHAMLLRGSWLGKPDVMWCAYCAAGVAWIFFLVLFKAASSAGGRGT